MRKRFGGAMLHSMRRLSLALAAGLLAAACGTTAGTQPAVVLAAPSATTAPTVVPSPTAAPGGVVPLSAGAVPQAGVVYLWGSDDGIYRYDGATGALTRVFGMSSLALDSANGPYVLGRHGGITLLRWDGSTEPQRCGSGSFAAISTAGGCAFTGAGTDRTVYVDHGSGPQVLLPPDLSATGFVWSPDGAELAFVRGESRPEPIRVHSTLWHLDRHGALTKIFDSASPTSSLYGLKWSFGRRLSFFEQDSTSESAAADGANIHLRVIDVDTGINVDLGHVIQNPRWSPDGRLAFVAGSGRETYENKQVSVLAIDGRLTKVAGSLGTTTPGATTALAPAWQPIAGAPASLAWIEAPADGIAASPDYFRGIGPTAQRVAVIRTPTGDVRMSCPGLVTEGIRVSKDATSALLLCRVPAVNYHALQIWYAPLGGTPRLLVARLGDLGFGFYGSQPSLLDITAWSLADR